MYACDTPCLRNYLKSLSLFSFVPYLKTFQLLGKVYNIIIVSNCIARNRTDISVNYGDQILQPYPLMANVPYEC